MRLAKFIAGLLTTTVLVASAAAQQAYTTRQVNLRAGPDRGYPLVAYVGPGQSVYVNGCINDYRWCDITAGANRGWAYAKFIEYPYQDRRLPIYGNGPTLALPIVSFILGSYWNDNYRNRPWYGQQNNWNNWRPGNRPPPSYGNGNRFRPPPQPPRPPIVRPQPPRPPVVERPNPGRPHTQPPRSQPPQGFPQKQGPGPSRPTGSMNL
jgi:uncharacterized protein YraI